MLKKIIKTHEKPFFSFAETMELLSSIVGDRYGFDHGLCRGSRCTLSEYFYEKAFLFQDNDDKFCIRRPNHYMIISECKCEVFITHAGILFLMENIEDFMVSEEEKECIKDNMNYLEGYRI
ncbi:MAG: hypothetical protein IPG79_16805 [Saprospiraceae bacterium]|nr:hypothetical protein [Saprospiraceae bacterium]